MKLTIDLCERNLSPIAMYTLLMKVVNEESKYILNRLCTEDMHELTEYLTKTDDEVDVDALNKLLVDVTELDVEELDDVYRLKEGALK